MGTATWTGIGEAAATGKVERLQGIATLTTTDLLRSGVDGAIDVPLHEIGVPGRAEMPLENGRFGAETTGSDYLEGNFHGSAHEGASGRVRRHGPYRRVRDEAESESGRRGGFAQAGLLGRADDAPGSGRQRALGAIRPVMDGSRSKRRNTRSGNRAGRSSSCPRRWCMRFARCRRCHCGNGPRVPRDHAARSLVAAGEPAFP